MTLVSRCHSFTKLLKKMVKISEISVHSNKKIDLNIVTIHQIHH